MATDNFESHKNMCLSYCSSKENKFFVRPMQRMFYRCDRHCLFLNWLVIVDCLGNIVLSRAGFIGRVHDAVCLQ